MIRFTRRYVERQTKGSWLGLLWVLLNPLLLLALFTVVFGLIMGGSFHISDEPGPFDFPLGIFIGLTVMGLITEAMTTAPQLILGSANLVKKVVFPLEILPVAMVGAIVVRTLMSCGLALLAIATVGPGLGWPALWFPFILLPLVFLALGISWMAAALGVYLRDLQQLMGFLSTALFYASAVFYPSRLIPEPIYLWLRFNPVLQGIELSRDVLLWDIPLDPWRLLYLYAVGLASAVAGYWTFRRLRNGFADVI